MSNETYVTYKNNKIYLKQDAHQDVPINVDYQWQAHGEDSNGNEFIVTWQQCESWDGEDGADACDWDDFEVIEL